MPTHTATCHRQSGPLLRKGLWFCPCARRRSGRSRGGRNGSRADKQRGGKNTSAVLRAKPAAERAAMFQKGWATRRAKAAAAQLAELEAEAGT
jgi:hypothetical protein